VEPATRTAKTNDKTHPDCIHTTYGHLNRMLAKHNIKSVALPPRKIFSYLPPVKDALGLRTPGVYTSHVNVARFIMGKVSNASKSTSKSTIDI
jgi:hypothetical protein